MNNAVSETINLRPCYLRIFHFDRIPQFGGELSNLTEIEHTGFYEHIIGAEIIIGKLFAVRTTLAAYLSILSTMTLSRINLNPRLSDFLGNT